ncbi:hypothetical protein EPUS_04717 [Endocarpon pusillum Z07020]|uniref:Nucleoside phosphorylase domain-containing protein n=1 Tax=Endocarpon pusillum (strain Z07020 / HMAS-L-300199) TaxID=1263415 RepID=U1HN30_ENDPU|nr:uncharacterized protein EPUS_04717 [Endocarpon pusillum Z07020]ERF70439.1 hypothetical protein EPUS_04717 [Endocarpon pusillum Z07020]
MAPSAPNDRRGFEIALICALQVEADAVHAIFDKFWEDEGKMYGQAPGDHNSYTPGVIGEHNVVLAYMPEMGKVSASGVAASLRSSFVGIKLALIVGICAGVPRGAGETDDIYLGDVIISTAVVQYDFGRQYSKRFEKKDTLEDSLGRPSQKIRSIVAKLRTHRYRRKLQENIRAWLRDIQQELPEAKYPGFGTDRLYEPLYLHKHRHPAKGNFCHTCSDGDDRVCEAALKMTCVELGCEEAGLVVRSQPQNAEESSGGGPRVHLGKMGSGDTVMKSAEDRDSIAKADNIIAFEMEGAGVWEHFPSIVIKGVCDYADSHKNKEWQGYAAATAAAGMKAFLKEWVPEERSAEQEAQSEPIWHVPFSVVQEFIGRGEEIKILEKKLFQPNGCPKVAVFGLGGVGKSRIALKLADNMKSQFPTSSIFWIQATNSLTFETDYFEIGKKLKIPGLTDEKANIKELVKHRLSDGYAHKWLMILDNADDEAIWGATSKLVETLQYLPLAIVQAAAFINMNDESIQTYLELLDDSEEHTIELLSEDFQDEGRYKEAQNPVASTWLISFEQIQLRCPEAAEYLSFMSCLNEKNIPQSLLPDAPSKKKMIDAIGTLTGYSFLRKQNDHHSTDPLYDMHRLVRLATRNWLRKENTLLDCTERTIQRVSELFPSGDHEYKDTWTLYMPHGQILIASELGKDLEEWYCLIEKMGQCLMTDGKYNEAVKMYSSVVRWREKKFGCLDKTTLMAYDYLGDALCDQGNWLEAEKYLKQALKGYKEINQDPEDLGLMSVMDSVGSVYWRQGRFQEAEQMYMQVWNTREEKLGPEHRKTLDSMNNLALVYHDQGRYMEAEELQIQIKEIRERVLGIEHPSRLASIDNLALTYAAQNRWEEAEELHRRVLEIRERVLDVEHPDTLTSMSNLASTYWNQGRLEEAEELEIQVLEKRRRVLGTEHPDTLISMSNLASTYQVQGRFKEAKELMIQVLEIRKRILGIEHPDTLISMNNLAWTMKDQGRKQEAISLMTDCAQLSTTKLSADHPDTKDRTAWLNVWMSEEQPFAPTI